MIPRLGRHIAAAAAALALTSVSAGAAVSAPHDHAIGALADIRAATSEIVRIEDGYAIGPAAYQRAAHRAINALAGRTDNDYNAAAGDPGDGVGALGHLDALLDRADTPRWTPAVQGAKANLLAAVQNLHDAFDEKEMEDYQADLTQAIANLSLVIGRPAVSGVLGGLDGALANTTLGVPANARTVSGCALPTSVPSYGVVDGRLAYVALDRASAVRAISGDLSVARVAVIPSGVILFTEAAADARSLCSSVSVTHPSRRMRTRARGHAVVLGAAASGGAGLYTAAQAKSGAKVYAANCISCHGATLQGSAGPAVAGHVFLGDAKRNGWHLSDVRTLVTENMPLSDPGSLTAKQYADVMAFLLASNCFPAGSKPFPNGDSPAYAKIAFAPPAGVKPANASLGTCPVK